jgi:hypothetical protein
MVATPSLMLLDALRAADPPPPPALQEFARIAGAPDPSPDFHEWSVRIGGGYQAARLTYYFDAGRHDAREIRSALGRFAELAAALGVVPPAALVESSVRDVPGRGEVLQVVLGIDERPGGGRRVKLYLVLREAAPGLIEGLLGAAGHPDARGVDLAKVYILGLDVGSAGVEDAKLYLRLDRGRLGQVVENLREVSDLYAATREVVFQRCLRGDRSQVYLHMDNPSSIGHYLARRARIDGDAARLLGHHAGVLRGLTRGRLEPWIISFAYRQRRLLSGVGNVYYHLVGVGAGGPRAPVDTPRGGRYPEDHPG